MFEAVMPLCAGLRRPGSAALDLCHVAAGHYDGFFETGLQPWDVAAGSLLITEAGGLIGNFTGEGDYLHQRELVAGNPKIFGQLVPVLSPFSRVIKDEPAAAVPAVGDGLTPEAALAATEANPLLIKPAEAPKKRAPVRIRKSDVPGDAPF